jgi:hypothetical protein
VPTVALCHAQQVGQAGQLYALAFLQVGTPSHRQVSPGQRRQVVMPCWHGDSSTFAGCGLYLCEQAKGKVH